MQGVFRARPQLDAGFDEVLTHPTTVRKVTEKVLDPAAVVAPPAPGPPGSLVVKDVVLFPPMQRFHTEDDKIVFINPKSKSQIAESTEGHWLVQYTIEEADTTINGVSYKLGRQENANRELQSGEKDALTAGEKVSLLSMKPPPNKNYAQRYRHYLLPQDEHYEIGELYLKASLEKAGTATCQGES